MPQRLRVATAAALLLAACASTMTESSTYKSPAAKGHEFRKVAVWARAGLAERQQTEGAAVKALKERRVDAYASLAIWPIDANDDEIRAKLHEAGIDSVLVLALDAASSTVTGTSTVSSTVLWGHTSFTNTSTTAQVQDNATYSATLFDEQSGRVIWQSQSFTTGNEGWRNIRNSFVNTTAASLVAARVMYLCFVPPPPPPDASQYSKDKYAERMAGAAPDDCPGPH